MSLSNSSISDTPAMQNLSWRFNHLSAADLLPILQRHLLIQNPDANWQLAWLNNDGKPIIALLPKMSWQVHSTIHSPSTYQVIAHNRDNNVTTRHSMSYEAWQQQLIAYSQRFADSCDNSDKPCAGMPPHYHHGLIGFIGYDIASGQLSPAAEIQAAKQPLAVLGHYDIYLTLTDKAVWRLHTVASRAATNQLTDENLIAFIQYLNALEAKLSKNQLLDDQRATSVPTKAQSLTPLALAALWSKEDYQQAFAQTQRYLHQGDCYQINLTQAWQGVLTDTHAHLIDYLPNLQRNTQAPFAGYLSVSATGNDSPEPLAFELLSCSPELFFTFHKEAKSGKQYITTKPIKGTTPRGVTPVADKQLKQQLINSDKDRSENVMIVDLLRNDLGKYAKIGSVKVPQLFAIESFSNVHHMVSTITAQLKPNAHPLTVLFGSLPAGSITGTPKKRAVEIISELEIAPRGAYCGTMGYMNFDGSGQWNVLIRSLQAARLKNGGKQVSLWAGGGITVASDMDAEYQECLDKVGNLLAVLSQADSESV